MVSTLAWRSAYHIIPSRYPVVGIFDDVAESGDLEAVLALAAATNPRVLEEAGNLRLVRDEDRISGKSATPIMAAFTHATSSRFGDGTFGIYYAAHEEATAIAETAFHRSRFLRNAHLPNERLDMRVYRVAVTGRYDDIRTVAQSDSLYDPDPAAYGYPQQHGLRVYRENVLDGIVFNSVRKSGGQCAAVFRPKRITKCVVAHHLEYRFREYAFEGAFTIEGPRR